MRLRQIAALVLTVASASFARTASAQQAMPRLFINTGPGAVIDYSHLRYEGRDWTAMTTLLKASFAITTGATLPNLAALSNYDALWIDQRYGLKPTTTDLNTMKAFAATGRRVVIVGENSFPYDLNFHNWSAPFVQALGGMQGMGLLDYKPARGPGTYGNASATGCVYGEIKTRFLHQLTAGFEYLNTGCAGYAIGGNALFNYNAVTLWGEPENVLTILDTNILDDYWGTYAGSPRFRNNLVGWLSESEMTAGVTTVPEPATVALFAPALLGIAAVLRRRRKLNA